MKPYADLYHMAEDDRITVIGQLAQDGQVVAFMVDDDGGQKGDRYIRKLQERFRVQVISRVKGPVRAVETINVGPVPN